MRVWDLVAIGIMALCGCDSGDPVPEPAGSASPTAPDSSATIMPAEKPRPGEASIPKAGLPPFGEREGLRRETGSWIQKLTPDDTPYCTFTEKPASARPAGLVVTAWSGNMDLLTEGYVLGHDHAIGLVEAIWMKEKPVIAARDGMDDLWIEPVGDLTNTILRIGPDELTCVQWEGQAGQVLPASYGKGKIFAPVILRLPIARPFPGRGRSCWVCLGYGSS